MDVKYVKGGRNESSGGFHVKEINSIDDNKLA